MKKIFIAAFIACAVGLLPNTGFSQNLPEQLNDYVTSQLTDKEKQNIPQPDNEETEDLSYDEIRAILQSAIDSKTCPSPEVVQNLSRYITEKAISSATGDVSDWEKRRSELYEYVKTSNWITGRNISEADMEFCKTLNTIFFGLIKEAARACGYDRILDRLEQESMNKQDHNEAIQVAIAAVENNIKSIFAEENNITNILYNEVQHNPFILLGMTYMDYQKLIKDYPEVKFLFEDMYTFFKWRYELRNSNAAYKLNENNIYISFNTAVSTNSFFAFWELANIAKVEMRIATEGEKDVQNTLTVSEERDNIKVFDAYAKQALYFGRIWNNMQHYAVKKEILPKTLDPKRSGNKPVIKKAVESSFQNLSNEQILEALNDVRSYYANAREVSEVYWNKWLTKQKDLQAKESLENLRQQIEQTIVNDTLNIRQDSTSFGIQE